MAPLLPVALLASLAALAASAAPAGGGGEPASELPTGRVLFVNGKRITSIDVESGRSVTRQVSVAGCGPDVYVTGGHVVFAELGRRYTVVRSVPVDLSRAPRRLGRAHAFVPSAAEGRVWLTGRFCKSRDKHGVKEVGVRGRVTAVSRHRAPGDWLLGAAEEGLLFWHRHGVSLWDPRTGRTLRLGLSMTVGVAGNRVAGCLPHTRCRRLKIIDVGGGRTIEVELPDGYKLGGEASFSPDGSRLAATVRMERRWGVALVDAANGSVAIIPGSASTRQYPELAWSDETGWLFFRADGGRVKAYRPGAERAVALPLRLPRRAVNFLAS